MSNSNKITVDTFKVVLSIYILAQGELMLMRWCSHDTHGMVQ
jgi:hypothetical protein